MAVTIRPARAGEGEALSALARRSKAAWGYDDAFMARSHDALTITEAQIAAGDVWVAEAGVSMLGVVALGRGLAPDALDLDALFVEPDVMGSGAGRALFEHAEAEARRRGAKVLEVLADPNATGFYQRMGANYVDDRPSDAIPGRQIPFLIKDLAE